MADKDKRIVYQGEDGIAKVVAPAPEFLENGGTLNDVMNKSVPISGKSTADIVDKSEILSDRTFRNAWETSKGKSTEVNLSKAKDIAKEKVREKRVPKFAELDVAYQRADEDGDADAKKAVADKKKVARDATKNTKITNADSVDKLKEGMEDVIKEVNDL
tara:strand:- start:2541 stop:3020 length:480 start_codon:yes stop_codon:yes gene_type:complete